IRECGSPVWPRAVRGTARARTVRRRVPDRIAVAMATATGDDGAGGAESLLLHRALVSGRHMADVLPEVPVVTRDMPLGRCVRRRGRRSCTPHGAHIARAATIDEPVDTAAPALREALYAWLGTPLKTLDVLEALWAAPRPTS